jgi:hypothetical protein
MKPFEEKAWTSSAWGKSLQRAVFGVIMSTLLWGSGGFIAVGNTQTLKAGQISVAVNAALEGRNARDNETIEGLGVEIIGALFPKELALSGQTKGTIDRIHEENGVLQCDMMVLFLYRATYTAVTRRVVFRVSQGRYTIITVDGKPWDAPDVINKTN